MAGTAGKPAAAGMLEAADCKHSAYMPVAQAGEKEAAKAAADE
jgi:hypothetical protein